MNYLTVVRLWFTSLWQVARSQWLALRQDSDLLTLAWAVLALMGIFLLL